MKLYRLYGAFLLAVLSVAPVQANLLTNGSFEAGNLSGWTQVLEPLSTATVFGSSPPFYATYDGKWQLALSTANRNFASSYIYQDIATTIGDSYKVSFALRPGNAVFATFAVAVDGTSLGIWTPVDSIFNPSANPPVKDYQLLSRTFTALSATSRVAFYWVDNSTNWWLDNTDVTKVAAAAVPEPSVMLMLGSGLMVMVAVRSRRRQS